MLQSPWSRIGMRNLGRNPKRTILTALGLAIGFFTSVVMVGWSQGLMNEMVDNATGLVGGQIEIHDAEFRPERSLYDTIGGRDGIDVDQVLAQVGLLAKINPALTATAPAAVLFFVALISLRRVR